MAYYVPDEDMELANKLIRTNVCAVCGRRLYIYMDMSKPEHPIYVACPTAGHEGIAKEYQPSPFEERGLDSLTLKAKEETMSQEFGEKKTTDLTKSGVPVSGALTKFQAMELLRLVYPNVPDPEIIRTAIICRDFVLHPLMKEIYIIPFNVKQKDGSYKQEWATVLGINATRKMMARMGSFSYIDNTPRVMTKEEENLIFGDVATDRIRAITKLRTKGGLEAQGYGHYLNKDTPYGMDKGNTKANMAFIRSEKQGFSRLFPDAIPQEIEVVDEVYVESVGEVNLKTGQILESEAKEVTEKTESPLETRIELEEQPAQEESEPAEKNESPITKEQGKELQDLVVKAGMSMGQLWKECNASNWTITKLGDLKVWQFEQLKARLLKGQQKLV